MKKLKGYTFYVDFGTNDEFVSKSGKTNKLKKLWTKLLLNNTEEQFNCIAIINDVSKESLRTTGNYEGIVSVFYHKNSGVSISGISPDYLRINCTRISQELAKKLHPKLIQYLEE